MWVGLGARSVNGKAVLFQVGTPKGNVHAVLLQRGAANGTVNAALVQGGRFPKQLTWRLHSPSQRPRRYCPSWVKKWQRQHDAVPDCTPNRTVKAMLLQRGALEGNGNAKLFQERAFPDTAHGGVVEVGGGGVRETAHCVCNKKVAIPTKPRKGSVVKMGGASQHSSTLRRVGSPETKNSAIAGHARQRFRYQGQHGEYIHLSK